TSFKFKEVIDKVSRYYVDETDSEALTETAIVALLEELDPHSTYIPADELQAAQTTINGSFVGVGIRFQIMKDTLNVVATISGGPAEKLGILPGDKIVSVDGNSIAGIGLKNSDVREKLMGELGSKVKVEVKRKRVNKKLTFNITRDKIPVFSVDSRYMIDDEIGYIKLNSFSRTTLYEVRNAIRDLKGQGMKSLIFDLQGNGGGLLDAAHKLADEFLSDEKLIVYSEGKAQPRNNLRAGIRGNFEKGKLIILTDEYSASASEILSGAIQDWDRGLVVGRRTFGKGLVQRPMGLSDGSEIRLTIARYFTPTGRFIQKPYDDVESYRKDISERYLNGEFVSADSIKMPDSLKFKTLVKNRTVFGGGGIMPDFFVPLDTTGSSDYFSELIRGGFLNTFSYEFTNDNRKKLLDKYSDFSDFNNSFHCDEPFMDSFFEYVSEQDSTLKYSEEDFKESGEFIKLRLKAFLARNLWDTSEFYQVYNSTNEILVRAIDILKSEEYNKIDLDN
ncbi:S41 family peptidase, partial [Crocinitomicaceae bacterium]|nr:S41 family peptidase [Crocinitomicaceae bacterium]